MPGSKTSSCRTSHSFASSRIGATPTVRALGLSGGWGPFASSAFPAIPSGPKSIQSGSKSAFKYDGYFVTAGGGRTSATPSSCIVSPAIIARLLKISQRSGSTVFVMSVVASIRVNCKFAVFTQGLLITPSDSCDS